EALLLELESMGNDIAEHVGFAFERYLDGDRRAVAAHGGNASPGRARVIERDVPEESVEAEVLQHRRDQAALREPCPLQSEGVGHEIVRDRTTRMLLEGDRARLLQAAQVAAAARTLLGRVALLVGLEILGAGEVETRGGGGVG